MPQPRQALLTPPEPIAEAPRVAELAIRHLRRVDLPVDTIALAKFLVGKVIVRELPGAKLTGCIVETEAYPPKDPAAHHFRGQTPRNRSMFLRRGHAYVYFTYGNHFMLNVTAELPGVGGGVLIRALQPLAGIEYMQSRRATLRIRDLARGPGRLAQSLEIDRSLDGIDLCAPGPLWLGAVKQIASSDPATVRAANELLGISTRIGITRAADRHLRFYQRNSPFVSGPTRLNV